MNKIVNVPALPGKAQIFPMADTFVPQDAIPCFFCKITQCAIVFKLRGPYLLFLTAGKPVSALKLPLSFDT